MEVQDNPVTIIDVDIPLARLVAIFVKFALAAIPASILVFPTIAIITAIFGALFGWI